MNIQLKDKIAVVCGSTQGIGKATAQELSKMGATLVLVARNEDKLKATLLELDTQDGQNHSYIVFLIHYFLHFFHDHMKHNHIYNGLLVFVQTHRVY